MNKFRDNLSNMAGLDLYLYSLDDKEYKRIKHKIRPLSIPSPLLALDFHAGNFHRTLEKAKRKNDLASILNIYPLCNSNLIGELILDKNYDALVLTDHTQIIQWVNKGFSKMTGYTAGYALGKTPKFLQGAETGNESRRRIREQLGKNEVFTEIVVNYRKNKEQYKCEITIVPLFDIKQGSTHFLAIEKEVA